MNANIIVADDHAIVRRGVILLLREILPLATIFQATDFDQIAQTLKENKIDLLICDINMPGCDNFKIIDTIRFISPATRVLIFSAYNEELYAMRYIQAGANGYLHKDCSEDEVKQAIRAVLDNGKYLSKKIKGQLVNKALSPAVRNMENPLAQLSNREMEVANLLGQGMGLLEVSNMLHIQISTASTYKSRLYDKLGISNIAELITLLKNYSTVQD
jgi:two-component system invasion response regulator UvrY